jgi:hypothetical protein
VSTRNTLVQSILASMMFMTGAGGALAADAPKAEHAAPTKEVREKMATLHEQMAACLRSDKPIAECRTEMAKSCQDMMGKEGCPMMGRGGAMHGHMMKNGPQESPKEPQTPIQK